AYGRPTPLASPIPRQALLNDAVLAPIFENLQGRRYLPDNAAARLAALVADVPVGSCEDPLPLAGDPDWLWTPERRRWGYEPAVSDRIAGHEPAWRVLGFARRPARERSPLTSRLRTDLRGPDRHGEGLVAEVKHLVAHSTLVQL